LGFGINQKYGTAQRSAEAIFLGVMYILFATAFAIYGSVVLRYAAIPCSDCACAHKLKSKINTKNFARISATRRLMILLIGIVVIMFIRSALVLTLWVRSNHTITLNLLQSR
jgi:hypothetical protein